LDAEQFEELVRRVEGLLDEPWDRPRGRTKKLTLRDAVAVTVAYLRQNIIQEVLGEMWDVSQPNVSDKIRYLTPLVAEVLAEFVPSTAEAMAMVPGRVCLVDGSLGPCWSWRGHRELWAGKHQTTGHNFQVITNLRGDVLFVSDPLPGSVHDKTALTQTPVADILHLSGGVIADKGYQGCGYVTPRKKPKGGELSIRDKQENAKVSRLRAPVERSISHLKTWRVLHTDYRRPLATYATSFQAAIGLIFFRLSF
jgi:transposase